MLILSRSGAGDYAYPGRYLGTYLTVHDLPTQDDNFSCCYNQY